MVVKETEIKLNTSVAVGRRRHSHHRRFVVADASGIPTLTLLSWENPLLSARRAPYLCPLERTPRARALPSLYY